MADSAARSGDAGAIRKTALVPFAAESMFSLIEHAEHYPAFLPWCSDATILFRDDALVEAQIGVDYRGLRFSFTTRNAKRPPEWMAIRLVRGPFRRFEGEWQLVPLSPSACKIAFTLRFEFAGAIAAIARPVFGRIADQWVDAFVVRAEQTLGGQPDRGD